VTARDEAERRAQRMLESLVNNDELNRLELGGFVRGFNKGKTMHVTFKDLFNEVHKQYIDWVGAYGDSQDMTASDIAELKRTLADLRNVAGCAFLKLQEIDADKKARSPKQ